MVSLSSISFVWTIPNFLQLKRESEELLQSPKVKGVESSGPEFSAALRPWGFYSTIPDEDKCVGVVLRVQSARSDSYRVKFTFSLVNANGNRTRSIHAEKFIEKTNKICTESCDDVDLISRRELEEEKSLLLPGDALLVHVHVQILNGPVTDFVMDSSVAGPSEESVSELSRDLWRLYKDGELADRCFIVGGVRMMAHSAILAARCPPFSKLFTDGSTEAVVYDIRPEVFENVLQAIYTETIVSNLNEYAEELLLAANMFGLEKLKDKVERVLISQIDVNNVARLLVLAFDNDAPSLKEHALQYLVDNKSTVKRTPGWKVICQHPEVMLELFATL